MSGLRLTVNWHGVCVFICCSCSRLYVCEFCFKCLTSTTLLRRHQVIHYLNAAAAAAVCVNTCGSRRMYIQGGPIKMYPPKRTLIFQVSFKQKTDLMSKINQFRVCELIIFSVY